MSRPPDPDRPLPAPTWRRIVASYALVVAVLVGLWVASRPIAGVLTLATLALAGHTARRLTALGRCLRECGGFTIRAGPFRVCVTRPGVDC